MHESYMTWLKDNQPKIFCICGCNNEIIIKNYHKYHGISKYISGHNKSTLGKSIKISKSYEKWLNDGQPKIFCQCSCNKEIIIIKSHKYDGIPQYLRGHSISWNKDKVGLQVNYNKGKKNVKVSGKQNGNWKGGISSLNHSIRTSNEYYEWRLQIFGRDNFTCQYCGVRGTYLEAHHIKSFNEIIKEYNIKNSDDALNCKILWDLNNGITYCVNCHNKLKMKGGVLTPIFR